MKGFINATQTILYSIICNIENSLVKIDYNEKWINSMRYFIKENKHYLETVDGELESNGRIS